MITLDLVTIPKQEWLQITVKNYLSFSFPDLQNLQGNCTLHYVTKTCNTKKRKNKIIPRSIHGDI